ncbi:uncharacterized protein [Arachis hypogaea]|uniref:uncharacterized protein isoform X1 n=1 Tax=Arachis hypogaea TaxID=3818 RepID=UPI000DEC726F|nr:uncharacterized protein LOC112799753 isoform X1 [Arachis hypogaea]XP_025697568.1 uncharacterized protein LOC112799753 isoform X1 [Arachis hypogaea]
MVWQRVLLVHISHLISTFSSLKLASAVAIAVANPTDLVKVRLQAEGKLPVILEKLRVVEEKRQEVEARARELGKQVKLLVRKWKEIVDEWVRLNQPGGTAFFMGKTKPQLKYFGTFFLVKKLEIQVFDDNCWHCIYICNRWGLSTAENHPKRA